MTNESLYKDSDTCKKKKKRQLAQWFLWLVAVVYHHVPLTQQQSKNVLRYIYCSSETLQVALEFINMYLKQKEYYRS